MIELRPYQKDFVDALRKSFMAGNKRIIGTIGCGAGKSCVAANISKSCTDRGNNVLFIVHRKELCDQIAKTFRDGEVDMSKCHIGMVQTEYRRTNKLARPKLIIVDEGHRSLANSYRTIINAFDDALVLALTASPVRLSGEGFNQLYSDIVTGVTTKWLIENNYLSPYKYYGVTLADTTKLHTKNGDFDKNEVEALMNQSYIFGSAVENWRKYAENKQTIVYCSSIATSKETVKAFQEAGINAEHLDGTTPKAERERIDKAFRDGKVTVLSNVDLFGEGYDVPDCECVILLRPTKSLSLHIQQSMRSMRYKQNKTAIILDHVGNYSRHGLPDDDREWTLEGRKKREKSKVTVRECPVCFAVNPATERVCKYCGAQLVEEKPKQNKKVVDDIILEEIKERPYKDYLKCKTFDELDLFRKSKKFHFIWTLHKCKELNIPIPQKYWYVAHKIGVRL